MAPQVFELIFAELKHEVWRKAFSIACEGPVERFGLDAIKLRQVGVEHDSLAANDEFKPFDSFQRDCDLPSSHRFGDLMQ